MPANVASQKTTGLSCVELFPMLPPNTVPHVGGDLQSENYFHYHLITVILVVMNCNVDSEYVGIKALEALRK